MKILITGGAGFIGSHLVEALLSDENEILIFDNCLTGKKENLEFTGNYKFINDMSITFIIIIANIAVSYYGFKNNDFFSKNKFNISSIKKASDVFFFQMVFHFFIRKNQASDLIQKRNIFFFSKN